MLFYLKRSFAALTPSIFLPLYKAFIRPNLEYAIQASSPILFRDCQALESVQKLAVKFIKGFRHVPYETALQRLQLFCLIRRRIRGDLICMYKIMHGLLDFPCDAVFAAPTRTLLERSFRLKKLFLSGALPIDFLKLSCTTLIKGVFVGNLISKLSRLFVAEKNSS